jgi:hypothetical protein
LKESKIKIGGFWYLITLVCFGPQISPLWNQTLKGRHDISYRKKLNTCPLKRITPLKESSPPWEKYSPLYTENDILPLSKTLYLGKTHEYKRIQDMIE